MSAHPLVPLGEVCAINPRQHQTPSSPDLPVSFVPMAAVDERWGEITEGEDRPFAEVAKGYTSFQCGDVLFAKITPCMENGKVAVAPDLTNGVGRGSTEFFVLRPKDSVLSEYLFFYFRQPRFREQAKRHFTGTAGQQRVPKSFMENVSIPLPPLDEQRRIVAVLNRAARIERLRAQAAERLREFVPALFVRMFGDPFKNPKRWTVRRLREVCVSARYGTSRKPTIASDEGMPVIRMGNVTYDGYLDLDDLKSVVLSDIETEKHSLKAGDILFNRTNSRELVGKTGIWDGRFAAVAASYFIRIRLDESRVRPAFTWAFLNSASSKQRLLSMSRGAIGQANINAQEIQSIDLPLPPIEIQERFAQIVEQAHQLALRTEVAATGAAELSNSMMAKLLSSRETSASDGTQIETRSSGV